MKTICFALIRRARIAITLVPEQPDTAKSMKDLSKTESWLNREIAHRLPEANPMALDVSSALGRVSRDLPLFILLLYECPNAAQ
jgi:hypothetical protein